MKIKTTTDRHKVGQLFENGADIVIVEYPKSTVVETGAWCHVFIHDRALSIGWRLWSATNWVQITTSDKSIFCLCSPINSFETLKCIVESLSDITFEVE